MKQPGSEEKETESLVIPSQKVKVDYKVSHALTFKKFSFIKIVHLPYTTTVTFHAPCECAEPSFVFFLIEVGKGCSAYK